MIPELHIWGPAFSLPSIDPACIAAVIYCKHALPEGQWVLVASSDPSLSPTNELPVFHDGSKWIGGFDQIVDYLRKSSNGTRDLDATLNPQQEADCTAYTSHIYNHLSPLLDLFLYVSSENYHGCTRPAYTPLLQWPAQWIIPSNRRAIAKTRTDHLGLSSLDVDASDSQPNQQATQSSDGQIPKQMPRRMTVSSFLRSQPQKTSCFRLDALVDAALKPLQSLLDESRQDNHDDKSDDNKFLFSTEHPSSLDCLALGYISLALLPDNSQTWLAETMKKRYPKLCVYVEESMELLTGHTPDDALLRAPPVQAGKPYDEQLRKTLRPGSREKNAAAGLLPWRRPESSALSQARHAMLDDLVDAIPLLNILFRFRSRILRSKASVWKEKAPVDLESPFLHRTFLLVGASIAAVFSIGGYLLYSSIMDLPLDRNRIDQRRHLSGMGEAGAMLAMASFGEDQVESARERQTSLNEEGAPIMEVDVTVGDGANPL